jgi:hypothetical protein
MWDKKQLNIIQKLNCNKEQQESNHRRSNYITTWSRVLLEKLIVVQIVKKINPIIGTRRFITVFNPRIEISSFNGPN